MLQRGGSGWRVAATVLVFLSLVACRTDGDADGPAPTNGSPGATTPDTEARPAASLGAEENGLEPESDPAAAVSAAIDDAAAARAERLATVRSWAYQLQGSDDGVLTLAAVATHGVDLLVVDSSRDGSDAGIFTEAELAPLQADGTIVLAYLSIGETESYRDYFDATWLAGDHPGPDAPSWLGPANPDFPDNYKVRYWEPGWQAIILGASGALPRLVAAGFDGVYLDIIDAYEFWEELPAAGPPQAGPRMAAFVEAIARTARVDLGRPAFLVFPQNGPLILQTLTRSQAERYLAAIDGIGVEDTFYFGDADENNPLDPQLDTLAFIDRFRAAGKLVLAVDYLTDPDRQADFYAPARAAGFVPFAGVRALDRVPPQP